MNTNIARLAREITGAVPTTKPDGMLQELLKLFPCAVWVTDTGRSYTTAELLRGVSGVRLTRRVLFDGQCLFAGRTGIKTRSPLFRLVKRPEAQDRSGRL